MKINHLYYYQVKNGILTSWYFFKEKEKEKEKNKEFDLKYVFKSKLRSFYIYKFLNNN